MKFIRNKLLILFALVLIFISFVYILAIQTNDELTFSGLIESDEIDISSKIPGRIDTLFVKRGQLVRKGQILALLESKEMDAKVEQAFGMMEASKAKYLMVGNGARIEEIQAIENLFLQAKAQFEFASKSWERIQKLFDEKVISLQERDEAEFKYKAAKEQMEAAKSKLEMIKNGARIEEINASKSLLHQAENIYKESIAYQDELNIVSPSDGEISNVYCDFGEIINSGYPVISLMPKDSKYLTLNVREDLLKYFSMDKIFDVNIPALDNTYKFKVDFISTIGDFANWRPTNQKGDFDLRTFEVHLSSIINIKELRPGMTANIKIKIN